MCQALVEIMQPYINEQVEKQLNERIEQEILKRKTRENILYKKLIEAGRKDDILKSIENREYQKELFLEFSI